MITLLIGHRGTGKTTLLSRIARYFREAGRLVETVDLDAYLEWRQEASIEELFARGEESFRRLESEALGDLVGRLAERKAPAFIAVGAGCLGPFEGTHRVWVRRDADAIGRVFLDRPRLDPALSPAAEYLARFPERQARYEAVAQETFTLREGFDAPNDAEKRYFLDEWRSVGGALTVPARAVSREHEFRAWSERRLRWGVELLELRDDLLEGALLARAEAAIPASRRLRSFRRPPASFSVPDSRWDWALELGPCPVPSPDILSLHVRLDDESVAQAGARLASSASGARCLKLAVPIASFAELAEGDAWAKVDPAGRSFLPRSSDGRWAWYRLLSKGRQPLSFFREDQGSAPDQPTLLAWADAIPRVDRFAAVLGDPIDHSRTPAEQRGFFREWKMPVLAIRVRREEWSEALPVLGSLGLTHAAVTSPLKSLAFDTCPEKENIACELGAVNTIAWTQNGWRGANTDLQGLAALVADQGSGQETAVWGGGGTLAPLRARLPLARFFSAREGLNRDDGSAADESAEWRPKYLVWAASSPEARLPETWKPEAIVDLSYREDSPARALARALGARYVSGIALFRAQAEGQRAFWNQDGER